MVTALAQILWSLACSDNCSQIIPSPVSAPEPAVETSTCLFQIHLSSFLGTNPSLCAVWQCTLWNNPISPMPQRPGCSHMTKFWLRSYAWNLLGEVSRKLLKRIEIWNQPTFYTSIHSIFLVTCNLEAIAGALAATLKYRRLRSREKTSVPADFVELPHKPWITSLQVYFT